jgi:hypothetical protein
MYMHVYLDLGDFGCLECYSLSSTIDTTWFMLTIKHSLCKKKMLHDQHAMKEPNNAT